MTFTASLFPVSTQLKPTIHKERRVSNCPILAKFTHCIIYGFLLITVIILGVANVQKMALAGGHSFRYQYHVLFVKFNGFPVVQCVLGKEGCLLGSHRQLSY